MNDTIAIGVDAGGTSTVAALSRGGRYVETIVRGPANATSRGVDAAAREIGDSVAALEHASGVRADALFVAAAGAGRVDVRDGLAASLRARFPAAALAVEDDVRVALRAVLPEGDGIVIVAGTGSVAYAECGEARVRVGGAGYLLGDEGSAFAIGLAAAKLLARTFDGRAAADETTAFVARGLTASDRDGLFAALYGGALDVARVAGLAPGIVAFASKGNRAATKIVQNAALELGDLVRAAANASGQIDRSPPVVFAGGLLRENSLLSFLLETRVTNEIAGAAIVRSRDEPALAALRMAEALA